MLTGLKENSEYTAQIYPYGGRVHAEIIRKNAKEERKGFYDKQLDLWLTVMNKEFGSNFRGSPRERDWIRARKWVNDQLELINKHGTVIVTQPKFLFDREIARLTV